MLSQEWTYRSEAVSLTPSLTYPTLQHIHYPTVTFVYLISPLRRSTGTPRTRPWAQIPCTTLPFLHEIRKEVLIGLI
jgi:hypothetical protein